MARTRGAVLMNLARSLRRAAAVSLLAACLPAAPTEAARLTTITVQASRSGYVDRTFTSPVRLYEAASSVTLSGSYAGFYVEPLDRAPERGFGRVWFSAFKTTGFTSYHVPIGDVFGLRPDQRLHDLYFPLAAGRYRIHVFGDRPATARLRFSGDVRAATLTAARSSRVSALAKDLAPVEGAAPPVAVAELPLPTDADALSFAALFDVTHDVVLSSPARRDACLGRPADLRCATAPQRSQFLRRYEFRTTLVHATATTWVSYYHRKALPRGENYGYFEAVLTPPVERVVVAVFTLALS